MMDICIDYCESTHCEGCEYERATKEEREIAMYDILGEKHVTDDNKM